MKHETTSSVAGEEEGGGTAALQPLPVSDEFISRLAGKCEEIFPLNNRLRRDEISDDEIHEMIPPETPSALSGKGSVQGAVLCPDVCESEHEMETRLKKAFRFLPCWNFPFVKWQQAMNCSQ